MRVYFVYKSVRTTCTVKPMAQLDTWEQRQSARYDFFHTYNKRMSI